MAENSKISWTDHTFNPWIGYGAHLDSGKACRRTSTANWKLPLRWNRKAELAGDDALRDAKKLHGVNYLTPEEFAPHKPRRPRVFCAADVFNNSVPQAWRADLFDLIERTPNLDWLLLTKRIGNVAAMMQEVAARLFWLEHLDAPAFPKNVWLGATICNQEEADWDIPKLLKIPAAVRFLSIEPMLGPIDLRLGDSVGCPTDAEPFQERQWLLDWVIVGGESGRNARPLHPEWVRSLRDQCADANVPFFFKQWGAWIAASQKPQPHGGPLSRWMWADGRKFERGDGDRGMALFCRSGTKATGCALDGVEHKQFPETGI